MNHELRRLRKHYRQLRQNLSASQVAQYSTQILERLSQWTVLTQSQNIAFFYPHDQEPNLTSLFPILWQSHRNIYLPRLNGKHLDFILHESSIPLMANTWGILEPAGSTTIPIEALNLILIPLVAFDDRGHRIGRGAGYYDRALASVAHSMNPMRCGIGYECQHHSTLLPHQAWDVNLHAVCTEQKLLIFNS